MDASLVVNLVNRSEHEPITISADVSALGEVSITETHTLSDDDVYAKNTLDDRERVRPVANESAQLDGGTLTVTLPPVSWTAIALA